MARAWVELPEGWGPSRLVEVAVKRAGYRVERQVSMATGHARLVVTAESPAAGTGLRA